MVTLSWLQDKEFETFNGPILMTTNCLVPPKPSYKDRVYVTGVVTAAFLNKYNLLINNHNAIHLNQCIFR